MAKNSSKLKSLNTATEENAPLLTAHTSSNIEAGDQAANAEHSKTWLNTSYTYQSTKLNNKNDFDQSDNIHWSSIGISFDDYLGSWYQVGGLL